MLRQIIFAIALLITFTIFFRTINRLIKYFRFTRPASPVRDFGKRFRLMLKVAFGQTKIFRHPVIGFFHALVFWGFCVILIGSIEMVIDGLAGTEKSLSFLGPVHDIIMASGDIFALLVAVSIIIFSLRRSVIHVKRFDGIEMKPKSHIDAIISLSLILLLMISLLGMNTGYMGYKAHSGESVFGFYPLSNIVSRNLNGFSTDQFHAIFEVSWWTHILTIFVFANYLPYSKHFHVFMSVRMSFFRDLNRLAS